MDALSEYDYVLPEDRIAQVPLADRASSKLLWLSRSSGEIVDETFSNVVQILEPGDLLVMNDTRVSAIRLLGRKISGGRVELLLLRELEEPLTFEAMLRPAKRLVAGSRIVISADLMAEVIPSDHPMLRKVRFLGSEEVVRREISQHGSIPLPPYISQPILDPERYQTVYAERCGSAAAPTAGLHFTLPLLEEIERKGIQIATVTLDVSIDTFRPIQVERLEDHVMHGEVCSVSEETARDIHDCKGRVIAVGTTSVRTLESFAVGPKRVEPGSKVTKLSSTRVMSFRLWTACSPTSTCQN